MYWGDYLGDTMHLSVKGHGAYLLLVAAYWTSGEPLLDDNNHLMAITRCDRKTWNQLKPILIKFFTVSNGLWRHKRIDDELERAKNTSNARHIAGKLGGKASSKIRANAKQLVKQTAKQNPTPSPSPIQVEEEKEEEKEDYARIEEIQAVEGGGPKLPVCVSAQNAGDRDVAVEIETNLPAHLDRASPDCVARLSGFERWWSHWTIPGTKRGKVAANKMFRVVVHKGGGPSIANLIDGLDRYMAHCQAEKTDVSKIIHPERWLSKGRWEDEYAAPRQTEGDVLQGIYERAQQEDRQDGDVC